MRELRRKEKAMGELETAALLTRGEYGVLSTVDADGQPYGVPLNYVFKDNHIYFHCALVGHKVENIDFNPKVSFCVVGKTEVVADEFTSRFESAIAFGPASVVYGEERYNALVWMLEKYSADFIEEGKVSIERNDRATKVVKIEVKHLCGKAK